jgi:hypothetical protein
MWKSGQGHHCIFLLPAQVERLRHLAETANGLFKRQVISIVDLLYAALWRQLSAIDLRGPQPIMAERGSALNIPAVSAVPTTILNVPGLGSTLPSPISTVTNLTAPSLAVPNLTVPNLTIIEGFTKSDMPEDHELMHIRHHTFICADTDLTSQPLVSVAERIRCALREGSDPHYEGWLVDSLGLGACSTDFPDDVVDLMCSSLSIPRFMNIMYQQTLKRLSHSRAKGGTDKALLDSAYAGIFELSVFKAMRENLPERSFFINVNGANASDARQMGALHDCVVSIDMWLPLEEIGRFKLVYGDCCFVDDLFIAN